MTYEEFKKLEWRFVMHYSAESEHILTQITEYNGHIIMRRTNTPTEEYKISHPRTRKIVHYLIDGKKFVEKKLEEAIKEL